MLTTPPPPVGAGAKAISALFIGALAAALLAIGLAPKAAPVAAVATDSVFQVEQATLNEIDRDGWDTSTGRLYINWSVTNPSAQNLTDANPMSCGQSCKDPMVDMRDLVDMETFEKLNPGDTSQQAAIARLYPVVKAEFPGAAGMHPWVYDLFLELYADTGDSAWLGEAKSYVSSYLSKYNATYSTIPDTFYNSSKCLSGALYSYRPDHNLQMAADFMDAQSRFGLHSAADGLAMARQTVTDAFSSTFHAFAQVICIDANNARYVGDSQVKVGEIGDSLLGVEDLYQDTGDSSWLTVLEEELDSLTGGPLSQLHDTTHGGFGFGITMPGGATTHCTISSGCVDNSYREIRQYLLMPIVRRADGWLAGRYAGLDAELQQSVLAAWQPGTHPGWPYREKPNYAWFVQGGTTTENWLTTEAMGIALHGLLYDQANSGVVTSASASSTPTATPLPGRGTPTPTGTPTIAPTSTPTPTPGQGTTGTYRYTVAGKGEVNFPVTLTAPTTITVTMSSPGGVNLELSLRTASGTLLAITEGARSDQSLRSARPAGVYVVRVYNTNSFGTTFNISVSGG
jgi:hypothetical protein